MSIYFPDPRLLVDLREAAAQAHKPVSTFVRELLDAWMDYYQWVAYGKEREGR